MSVRYCATASFARRLDRSQRLLVAYVQKTLPQQRLGLAHPDFAVEPRISRSVQPVIRTRIF